jgi:hypothetical protein
MLRKVCGRVQRLGLTTKLRSPLALLLGRIGLRSLKRGRRSDCGVVACEARPSIPRHGRRSLRFRTRPVQPRSPSQSPAGLALAPFGKETVSHAEAQRRQADYQAGTASGWQART